MSINGKHEVRHIAKQQLSSLKTDKVCGKFKINIQVKHQKRTITKNKIELYEYKILTLQIIKSITIKGPICGYETEYSY